MKSELIEVLHDPAFWPGKPDDVSVLETHISWVFLAGNYAWKIKKPVRFDFVDFSSLDDRKQYCEREVELNRRTAPHLYLGVVPICGLPSAPRVGGTGNVIEYAVKMQRFDQDQLFLHLARSGALTPSDIDGLAEVVARFHSSIRCARSADTWGSADEVGMAADANFEVLLSSNAILDRDRRRLADLNSWSRSEQRRLASWFNRRKTEGFVRECHGDLHLRNIVRYKEKPCLFDCIEFNESFRWIDVINDIAFLVSDLEDHGLEALGWRFLNGWLEASGDYEGLTGLPFYLVYRAMVRAKVNILRIQNDGLSPAQESDLKNEFRQYISYAEAISNPKPPSLIIMHGLSGSGKTTVSSQMIESMGAIRVRSDVERKRLAEKLPASVDLYCSAVTVETYDHLEEVAKNIVGAGFSAIIDAAFLRHSARARFSKLAKSMGVPFRIACCEAPEHALRERIDRRNKTGTDASDADASVLELQMDSIEPLTDQEREHLFPLASAVSRADLSPSASV